MEPVYTPVIAIVTGFFKAMNWDIGVTGAEHVPAEGPAVLATNHVGYLDFTFVGYGAHQRDRLVRFLAKKEVFDHRVAGPLMRGMKHVPVDRYGRARDALDESVDRLHRGQVIGMFPEGTISRSFMPAAGKTGAARMAMAAGAPLIPGAVWGSQRILTKGRPRNFQRNVVITVTFGPAIPYAADDQPQQVTDRLMASIGELVDAAQRTYPQRPANAADGWWLPAHLGGTAPTVEEAAAMATRERIERRKRRRAERRP